jgi:putative peptide zinc metalloprotease protein
LPRSASENAGAAVTDRDLDEVPVRASGLSITIRAEGDAIVSLPPHRFLRVSVSAARLLELIDGRRPISEIAHALRVVEDRDVSAADVRRVVDEVLSPAGLASMGTSPPSRPARSALWLRVPILDAAHVNAWSGPLVTLFRPRVAIAMLSTVAAAYVALLVARPLPGLDSGDSSRALWEWAPAVLAFAPTVLLHELGHAAALRASGERAGAIAIGMYTFVPVVLTDVSAAWRLPRAARLRVDVGGVYVQVVCGAVLATIGVVTGAAWATAAAWLVGAGLLVNANPFLRTDGYWVAVDLAGGDDLEDRALDWWSSWPGASRRVPSGLVVYAWLGLGFFVAVGAWLALRLIPRLVEHATAAAATLRAVGPSGGEGARAIVTIMIAALVIAGAAGYIVRGVSSAVLVARRWRGAVRGARGRA